MRITYGSLFILFLGTVTVIGTLTEHKEAIGLMGMKRDETRIHGLSMTSPQRRQSARFA